MMNQTKTNNQSLFIRGQTNEIVIPRGIQQFVSLSENKNIRKLEIKASMIGKVIELNVIATNQNRLKISKMQPS